MTADMDSRLAIDTAVLLLYFIVIISIGLYMGRKEENLKDFALGGRAIPWWAVLASIIAAETSAGTFFGTPGEGFTLRNYTYLQLALGTILAREVYGFTEQSGFIRSTNILRRASACRRKTRHPLFSCLHACWRPVRAYMWRRSRLRLRMK